MREVRIYYVSENQRDWARESTVRVCLQTTNDYSPFGVSLDGRTIAYQPAPAPTPAVGVINLHKFDDGATTHPYTTAPDQIDPNLSNGVWTNNTNYWYNYTGYTGKAIAINRADYDTARLYLNFTVASGKNMDVKSFSFYHRSSSTGYSNYKLYVNNILVGSGTIYVTSNSNLLGTGTINVANPVSGLSGNVTVRLDLFGGLHGIAATFRLDNFTLNGYTQLVGAPNLLAKGYRYGFDGMEKDDELKGAGNSYTTEFRQYDPRVGRWLSLDPLMAKFPWMSPYVAFNNTPTIMSDPSGLASEGGPGDGWTKGDKGSRKKDNGNGTVTYDAPVGNVVLPERAKIVSTLQDGNGNNKVDYKGKKLEGNFGDVNRFNLDGNEYIAKYTKGKFLGYFDETGKKYSISINHSSNQLNFRGWDDQNPPFESVALYGSIGFNSPDEGNSISGIAENSQEGTIETSVIKSRQTDIFGIPKISVNAEFGFDFKTREAQIETNVFSQFEISTSMGYVGISYYSNSKGEKGFKVSPSLGFDVLPFSITNSTIRDDKQKY